MKNSKLSAEPIDVAYWHKDEEFAPYPEGAREKTLLYCPEDCPYDFLIAGHRYLFKKSAPRGIEQFWIEIFAYQLGAKMCIDVPRAFVGFDSKTKQCGALIEWFLLYPSSLFTSERYVPGGDYCQEKIINFDRKKGKQHNFETIMQIFCELTVKHSSFNIDWKKYWAKVLMFDALIGNTDRHQDNWGIIVNPINNNMRIAPAFDNGTSMGYEIAQDKFDTYDKIRLQKYVQAGWHHMKWRQKDVSQAGHMELLLKLVDMFPETKDIMLNCLKMINKQSFKDIFDSLIQFDMPVRLSRERAEFMLKLLNFRHARMLNELEK